MTRSILVVEDHAVVREPLARLLRFEGYRTLCAANGNEAIDALEREPVDLVLLDLMMPKRDGVSFLEHVRDDARWSGMPVILLTGVIEGSLLDRARALRAAVLPKSKFSIEELLMRVRKTLEDGGRQDLEPFSR